MVSVVNTRIQSTGLLDSQTTSADIFAEVVY